MLAPSVRPDEASDQLDYWRKLKRAARRRRDARHDLLGLWIDGDSVRAFSCEMISAAGLNTARSGASSFFHGWVLAGTTVTIGASAQWSGAAYAQTAITT